MRGCQIKQGWEPQDSGSGDAWRGRRARRGGQEEMAGPEYWAYRIRAEMERAVDRAGRERTRPTATSTLSSNTDRAGGGKRSPCPSGNVRFPAGAGEHTDFPASLYLNYRNSVTP